MERENLIFTHKILIYLLPLSYSMILHLESHCSTIANFFAIVITSFDGVRILGLNAKICLHLAFGIWAVDALRYDLKKKKRFY